MGNAFPSILITILLISTFSSIFVSCTQSDELLKEDLALPSDVHLDDGDYEIVQFWHREFKSGDDTVKQLRYRRAGEDVHLTAKQTSVIRERAPVWLIYSENDIRRVDENIISDAVKFYEHPELSVSLATNVDDNDHLYFVGSISQATVKPLSERTIRSLRTEKPHLFQESMAPGSVDETGKFTLTNYHVIYESKLPESGNLILPPMGHPELFNKARSQDHPPAHRRLRRTTGGVVYPEILAVLDYDETYTTIYEFRFLRLLMYTITFWNSVNHRYESLEDPPVRLRLTGIAVLMNRTEFAGIRDATINNMLNADIFLNNFSVWLYNNIEGEYDLIVTLTTAKICRYSDDPVDPSCIHDGILGSAVTAPICPMHHWTAMTAVITDDMKYLGERSAVHEIGHILGADHDDDKSPADCFETEGYIMSWNTKFHKKFYEWSRCSKEQMSDHLQKLLVACLYNSAPTSGSQGELIKDEVLPGHVIGEDEQCRRKGFRGACKATNVCENLRCRRSECSDEGPALEGTSCPKGECHNGKCVPKL